MPHVVCNFTRDKPQSQMLFPNHTCVGAESFQGNVDPELSTLRVTRLELQRSQPHS